MTPTGSDPPLDPSAPGEALIHRFAHRAMACRFEVYIAGQPGPYARQAADAAFEAIDLLEKDLSRFMPGSDISRINALSKGKWVKVSSATLECLEIARQVFDQTAGAFDVTVGAILREPGDRPRCVGMDWLQLSREHHAVGLAGDNISVDLGAIGKGFALDQAARTLAEWGVDSALLHSGQSTVLPLGQSPSKSPWRVALRDPADHERIVGHAILDALALSGSGLLLHGDHIVDPATAAPPVHRPAAWALAPSAALSDALSTAFMVMPRDAIERCCCARPDLAAAIASSLPGRPLEIESLGPAANFLDLSSNAPL